MELKQNGQTVETVSITDYYDDFEMPILYSFSVTSGTYSKYCDLKVVTSGVLTHSGGDSYTFDNDSAESFNVYYVDDDTTHYNFQGYIVE